MKRLASRYFAFLICLFTFPAVSFAVGPSITSISPVSGVIGTPVTINGSSFGNSQGNSTVKFNGTTAAPSSWSATKIVVSVPSGATSGNIVVTVSNKASNGVNFTVFPNISSLSLNAAAAGISITISGSISAHRREAVRLRSTALQVFPQAGAPRKSSYRYPAAPPTET